MVFDPHDMLPKEASILSNPEWQLMAKLVNDNSELMESIERASSPALRHPSAKTNELLIEANSHALEQSQLLRKASDIASQALSLAAAAEIDASVARRAAIFANIIATIAMAIAIKDQIIEFVISWLL